MASKRKKKDQLLKRMSRLIDMLDVRIIDASMHADDNDEKYIYPPNIDGKSKSESEVLYDERDKVFTVSCPHCSDFVQILAKQMNCKQFRHGAYIPENEYHRHIISKYRPINPHSSWQAITRMLTDKKIVGCGGAFKIIGNPKKDKSNLIARACGYGKQQRDQRN